MASQTRVRPPAPIRYSVRQVAESYHVSQATVRSWIAAGELTALNVASKSATRPRLLIPSEALVSFDEARKTPGVTTTQRLKRRAVGSPVKDFF